MSYTQINISDLVAWDGNPRRPVEGPEREELKANIKQTGLLVALVGRTLPDGKVQIVAGGNRLSIVKELADEGVEGFKDGQVPVDLRNDIDDDADALSVALSENVKITMHPMDQYEAFSRLVAMGRDTLEIANAHGITPRVVEQRLSYAKLDPRARQMVRDDKRDLEWAGAMTMASPSEQQEMLDEIESDPQRYRNGTEVRRRMENALVPLDYALFDHAEAGDQLVRRDLFDNDRAYLPMDIFNKLQDKALEKAVEEAKNEGWSQVQVVASRSFDRYRYNDGITDKERASVIFVRHPSGEIIRHKGLMLRPEERTQNIDKEDEQAANAIFGDDDESDNNPISADATEPDKSDASQGDETDDVKGKTRAATEQVFFEGRKSLHYNDANRELMVQAAVMRDPRYAKEIAIATMGGIATPTIFGGSIARTMNGVSEDNRGRRAVETALTDNMKTLSDAAIDMSASYADIMSGLQTLSDVEIDILLAAEIAKRLRSGASGFSQIYNEMFEDERKNISDYYQIDRGYLETLTIESLRALANDILPARYANKLGKNRNDMIETFMSVVEDDSKLSGMEREKLQSWTPSSIAGRSAANVFNALNDDQEIDDEAAERMFG